MNLTLWMIARECSRLLGQMQSWRRHDPDVTVLRDGAALRISCEGREVRIVPPVDALAWSLDDFSSRVLLDPLVHLTNYEPSLGG
jgi:hypothetical protein